MSSAEPYPTSGTAESSGAGGRKPKRAVLSCSECRRLKLKCDRQVPCASCVKRGLSNLCPDGSLQPTRTSKLAAGATALADRVELLENLLRDNGLGHAIPPLPSAANVAIDMAAKRREAEGKGPPEPRRRDEELDTISAGVGSLTVGDDGSYRFLGTSAGMAYRGKDEGESSGDEGSAVPIDRKPALPNAPPLDESPTFPFTSTRQSILEIQAGLPEPEEVRRISSCYWDYCSFMFCPIPPTDYWQDYFENVFSAEPHGPKLACVFMVLALGSQFDPSGPSTPAADPQRFFALGQAALSASGVLALNTIPALQALHLCGNILFNRQRMQQNGETFFPLLGMSVKMAQSMGLHRDPAAWGLADREAHRRRLAFWELFSANTIHTAHFDTAMPEDASEPTKEKWKLSLFLGEAIDGESLSSRMTPIFSVKQPHYGTILSFDQKLRRMYADSPPSTRCAVLPSNAFTENMDGPSLEEPASAYPKLPLKTAMEQHTFTMLYTVFLTYMHKASFAQALERYPDEPLRSPWAASVRAVILEASAYTIRLNRSWVELEPVICPRWWHMFFHLFVTGVSQSSLIIRSPNSMLVPHAWNSLNEACTIFEKSAPKGAPGATLLPRIDSLRQKAYEAIAASRSVPAGLGSAPLEQSNSTAADLLSLGTTTQLSQSTKGRRSSAEAQGLSGEQRGHGAQPRHPAQVMAEQLAPPRSAADSTYLSLLAAAHNRSSAHPLLRPPSAPVQPYEPYNFRPPINAAVAPFHPPSQHPHQPAPPPAGGSWLLPPAFGYPPLPPPIATSGAAPHAASLLPPYASPHYTSHGVPYPSPAGEMNGQGHGAEAVAYGREASAPRTAVQAGGSSGAYCAGYGTEGLQTPGDGQSEWWWSTTAHNAVGEHPS
ncbi:hypothetical protein JCM10213v2_006307 [Rhodosporidiobolus nylandii]